MAHEQHFLEYGTCKSCNKPTIFQYIGEMGDKIERLIVYNCLQCKGTFQLNKLEKAAVEVH
jgi:hypothetical protein